MKLVRRLIGAAGVSALIAGGVMFAASPTAQAYDPKVWDKVAFCESTNRWSVNTGNGYYGGLQFSRTTWLEFGGGTYAKFANQATKAEQIAVARRVLAVQGPGAWPVCSKRAGLTKVNGGADRNAKPGQGGASSKPAPAPAKPKPSKPSGTVVTVRSGDTLSAIARRHNVSGGWQAIAKTNSLDNPNYIRIGQRLVLP